MILQEGFRKTLNVMGDGIGVNRSNNHDRTVTEKLRALMRRDDYQCVSAVVELDLLLKRKP
jgi:hypothetical protein